jgi:hypothetical protein
MTRQHARLQPVGCAQGFRNGGQISIGLENNSRITLLEGILQTLPAVDARYDAQGLAVFAQNGAGAGSCRLKRRDAGNNLHRQMRRAFAKGTHEIAKRAVHQRIANGQKGGALAAFQHVLGV